MRKREVKKMINFMKKHREKGMASFNVTTTNEMFIISTKTWDGYEQETLRLKVDLR